MAQATQHLAAMALSQHPPAQAYHPESDLHFKHGPIDIYLIHWFAVEGQNLADLPAVMYIFPATFI